MDRETQRLVEQLEPARLRVLEISGTKWSELARFKEYRTLAYPEFDICHAPLGEQFDLIIAEQVWEHVLQPYRATKHVYAMLPAGGFFLLTTPFLLRVHEQPQDCSRWTEAGLRHLLAEAGFPLEKIRTSSWGNRRCIKANWARWMPYRPGLHSLKNEPAFPVVVWALAQK